MYRSHQSPYVFLNSYSPSKAYLLPKNSVPVCIYFPLKKHWIQWASENRQEFDVIKCQRYLNISRHYLSVAHFFFRCLANAIFPAITRTKIENKTVTYFTTSRQNFLYDFTQLHTLGYCTVVFLCAVQRHISSNIVSIFPTRPIFRLRAKSSQRTRLAGHICCLHTTVKEKWQNEQSLDFWSMKSYT